jgi:ABC-type multidrug transport system fused ATPase/permease subunit
VFSTLLYLNPLFSATITIYFVAVMFAINKLLHTKVDSTNRNLTNLRISSVETITNFLKLYREFKIYRRVDFATKRISKITTNFSSQYAKDMWMQMIPKYALELAVLGGVFIILVVGRLFEDTSNLILICISFFAAGARVVPSILRVQASIYTLKGHEHLVMKFFEMRTFFSSFEAKVQLSQYSLERDMSKSGEICFSNVEYRYPNGEFSCHLDFSVPLGNKIAIVGSSGAGKSTLADLIMGIAEPDSGEILIGGIPVKLWLADIGSGIAYLPQETILIEGDVYDNVALGISRDLIDFDLVQKLLSNLNLTHLSQSERIDSSIESSTPLVSGGERQRIGVARALYSCPSFIVMDESTSSLDADSEQIVLAALEALGQSATLLVIAHRLSSIRNFDTLIYLESGKVSGIGDFDSLRRSLKRFDNQASLLGL